MLATLLLLLTATAHAGGRQPGMVESLNGEMPVQHGNHAESVRLSRELQRLAARNHWDGVEHTYQQGVDAGAALSFEDHMVGVQAAFSRGDIGAARERLFAANSLRAGETEVIDGLWEIDTTYARVRLFADPGARLEPAEMPFNQHHVRAIGAARAQLEHAGTFDGYLPEGDYSLASTAFSVSVAAIGREALVVDIRSEKTRRRDHDPP
ncbi:MAG: hypothetical protein JRI25_25520 [Deltaproteobacteria bacterium]|nr:hypothetical protein [Deltaproteobacteria bacterium]MBW2257940.1 hypothetical protein [Deltaproteobacteria bacterium]